jgi:hypothetical protein
VPVIGDEDVNHLPAPPLVLKVHADTYRSYSVG